MRLFILTGRKAFIRPDGSFSYFTQSDATFIKLRLFRPKKSGLSDKKKRWFHD